MKYEIVIQMLAFIGFTMAGDGGVGAPCTSDLDCKTGFNIICVNSICKARAGPGSQCVFDNECLQGLVCGGNNPAIKTCAIPSRPKMALGGQCEQDSDCLSGLICGGTNAAIKTCAAPPSGTGISGSPCTSDSDCKTGFGLFCMNQVCRTKMPLGGQCAVDSDCLQGLVCGGSNAAIKTCAAPTSGTGVNGSPCTSDSDCKTGFGLFCLNNICRTKMPLGGQCEKDSDCLVGLICGGNNALIKTCAPGTSGNGTGVAGTPCTSNGDCKTGFGLYCANSVCAAQKTIGTNCTLSSECLTGACQMPLNGTQAICATGGAQAFVPFFSLLVTAIFLISL